ncbi:MAG: FAD-dependent oxidoreductase [bacterium]|nr:FAD-dependent oxidoreductase [bacterium]
MNYTIIGNSAAAIAAIESIRSLDQQGEIVLFSKEPQYAYSRPTITEFLASEKVMPEKRMGYRPPEFYAQNKVTIHLSTAVVKLNPEKKTILLDNGKEEPFDKLLIATGGTPIIPDTPGKEKPGVFSLITWDEAKKIKAYLPQVESVVVFGGGLIGMKTTEGLYEAGKKVTIIELMPHILGRILDAPGAELIQQYLTKKGVEIITNTTVEEVLGENHIESVRLRDGTIFPCDMLIFAIGVKPNFELVKDTGIQINRGIVVNERMQTNFPDIYAAGDVAKGADLLTDQKSVIAIWPLAYQQGKIAGINMAGGVKVYEGGVVQNSIGLLGLHTISIGLVAPPKKKNMLFYPKKVRQNSGIGNLFSGIISWLGLYSLILLTGQGYIPV